MEKKIYIYIYIDCCNKKKAISLEYEIQIARVTEISHRIKANFFGYSKFFFFMSVF